MLLQSGKTEYKSVTVADNATVEEFMDFYLDDPSRHTWVRGASRKCIHAHAASNMSKNAHGAALGAKSQH